MSYGGGVGGDVEIRIVPPHPLEAVFAEVLQQCTKGKGVRHGGDVTPFLEQPWAHYHKLHGRGFLTGQAAKKLEEAASTRNGEAFIAEALGAIVYIGMAVIKEREQLTQLGEIMEIGK